MQTPMQTHMRTDPQAVARKEVRSSALKAAPGAAAARKGRPAPVVSSTALTPGTEFMHDVVASLGFFVAARASQARWRDVRFEVSGATVAGEGEVKILGRLARPWRHVRPGETHVMVGDDADLILMALMSRTPGLHVLNASLSDGGRFSPHMKVGVGRRWRWSVLAAAAGLG
jgi:5'-3' exonuclease